MTGSAPPGSAPSPRHDDGLVALPGGEFLMGSDDGIGPPSDGEGPVRTVTVEPFRIDRCAVTNDRFAEFVDAAAWVTDAERIGWSFVFAGLLPDDFGPTRGVVGAEWWRQVEGADWRRPEGPGSDLAARADHPVVHVSFADAQAYCRWAGLRLPSEAEWEYAARGGLVQQRYPWGDEFEPDGVARCNIWRGVFPSHATRADGYLGTAPVDAFDPNGYGLHNMVGNVWEWCDDRFDRGPSPSGCAPGSGGSDARVMRGGSYLCHESYCFRYRVSARSSNTSDSSTGNIGFRAAR